MARRTRSAQTENRTNRLRLPIRRKPFYTRIGAGVSLGYRRNKGAGTWTVKVADGNGSAWIKAFGIADDHQDANGANVLSYWQAQDKARIIARGESYGDRPSDRPITVGEAVEEYASDLQGRNGDDGNVTRLRYHLTPTLTAMTVALLTARDLRQWRERLLKSGMVRATVNRTVRPLKAALNLAAREDHRIVNTAAWRDGLRQLPDAETPRNEILPDADVRKLIEAAYQVRPAYGLWIEVHAVTGARTSQINRLIVADLQDKDPAAPKLMMPSSRKGSRKVIGRKPVPVPPALAKALRRNAAGRGRTDPLIPQPGAENTVRKLWKRARETAGLAPKVTPYALRHSSIVRMLLAGTPMRVVAVHHDTSIVMIERNYSAYIGDHADALTRRTLLDLAAPAGGNVVPLSR
jgi:integrase